VTLEQTPVVEGALVAIDNRTGQIKAMVGGWSFSRSKFNRAVQAYRQLGSTFKPFVYTAAIDRGFTPTSILVDTPVSYQAGNGQVWSPQNYDHKFEGRSRSAGRSRSRAISRRSR
jgi:penicillin-binding protein 1A